MMTANGIERKKAIENGDKSYLGFCKKCGIETQFYTKASSQGSECMRCSSLYLFQERYNITDVEWLQMYEEQGGKCANSVNSDCEFTYHNRWWEQGGSGFNVDHNHETGVIRGLLCCTCNIIEGMLDKHPEKVEGMKEYKQNDGFSFSFPKFTKMKKEKGKGRRIYQTARRKREETISTIEKFIV